MIRWLKHKTRRSKRDGKRDPKTNDVDINEVELVETDDKENHCHIYEEIPDLIPNEYRNSSTNDMPCFFLVGTSSIAEIGAPRDEVCTPYMVVPVPDLCSYEMPLSCQSSLQGSLRGQQHKGELPDTSNKFRDNILTVPTRTGVDNCRALSNKLPHGTTFRNITNRQPAKFLTELNNIVDKEHIHTDADTNDSFDTVSLTTVSSMSSAYGWVRTDLDSETEADSDSDEDGYINCNSVGSSRPSSRCSSEYQSSALSSGSSVASSGSSSTFRRHHHQSSTSASVSTCSSLSEMSCEDTDTFASAIELTRKQIGGENSTSSRSRSNQDLLSAHRERTAQKIAFQANYLSRNRLLGDLIKLNYDRQMFASL